MTIHLILIDDHTVVRRGLRSFLESFADIAVVGEAASGEAALEHARELLMIIVRNAQAVVKAPVMIPFPLLRNVFSNAVWIESPAARHSVKPEIRWIEKSMPSPRRSRIRKTEQQIENC